VVIVAKDQIGRALFDCLGWINVDRRLIAAVATVENFVPVVGI
jgi:hypothetical protein